MDCNYEGTPCKYKIGVTCHLMSCMTTCAYHPYNFTGKNTPEIEKPTHETIANCVGLTINEQGHIVKDNVDRPAHYADKQIEVIDYIKDTLTPEQYQGYCLGNVIKYISRYQKKNGREDLKKAAVYLRWLTESMEETK